MRGNSAVFLSMALNSVIYFKVSNDFFLNKKDFMVSCESFLLGLVIKHQLCN